MKVLILNSGMGSRMADLTRNNPKCMVKLSNDETILSRQLKLLEMAGLKDVIITTGYKSEELKKYINSLQTNLSITLVHNEKFEDTNYIYSIELCGDLLDDDILLLHGDLVFDMRVLKDVIDCNSSCVVTNSAQKIDNKDFKAVIDKDGKIKAIGVEFLENSISLQPLYKLKQKDAKIWLDAIHNFCKNKDIKCYAENALNTVSQNMELYPLDEKDALCSEIDNQEDLDNMKDKLAKKSVYVCFSTDVIHNAHISILKRAKSLVGDGKVIVGVMSDVAVASYKNYPLLDFDERMSLFESLSCVDEVVEQKTLSYHDNLLKFLPDFVVHGDDWQTGTQKPIRDEVVEILATYGGRLVEYPYDYNDKYKILDNKHRVELSLPDSRRGRLKKLISQKGTVTALEAHSGITGLIAEKTVVIQDGIAHSFDAMWVSSLCDSTAKGKPDIELVDMTSRIRTIEDIMEVTTKPIIFDGDTGGLVEHFVYNVRTLERLGVSMVIIEDKTGLKKNSLFGTDVEQTQDSIENFCHKISAGKKAQKSKDFMICARIESLILEKGMEDALKRAFAYVKAGADAIMIHSRKKDPAEIFEFVKKFRAENDYTPIVVVPTSFNTVTEEEFAERGVNVIIYANQLTRTGFPAMQNAAKTILTYHRAKECDDMCMPIKDIITLIPEEG